DQAVRNLVAFAGVPLADALGCASTVPAATLGRDDRGVIAPGAAADLVLVDPAGGLGATGAAGRIGHGTAPGAAAGGAWSSGGPAVEVVIVGCPDDGGALVGGAIADLLRSRPDAVLGLATGSSPLAVYRDLARRHAGGEVSFARARAFLLDEYVGLAPDHPQS